jgi:hypothetical protein
MGKIGGFARKTELQRAVVDSTVPWWQELMVFRVRRNSRDERTEEGLMPPMALGGSS